MNTWNVWYGWLCVASFVHYPPANELSIYARSLGLDMSVDFSVRPDCAASDIIGGDTPLTVLEQYAVLKFKELV